MLVVILFTVVLYTCKLVCSSVYGEVVIF